MMAELRQTFTSVRQSIPLPRKGGRHKAFARWTMGVGCDTRSSVRRLTFQEARLNEADLAANVEGKFRCDFLVWVGLSVLGLVLVASILGAPLALMSGYPRVGSTIYKVFSFVCHQIPERSFHLAGHQFGVCSRCTGLYAGFAVAALVYPLARSLQRTDTPSRRWLVLATLPLVVDFALGYFSIWENTHLSRFLTGALLSSVAVFYIMPGLIDLSQTVVHRFSRGSARETL